MFMRQAIDKQPIRAGGAMWAALTVTGLATLVIGIYPEPFIDAVNWVFGIAHTPAVAHLIR